VLKGGRRASGPHRRGGRIGWLARGGALLALGSLGSLAAALDRSRAADTVLLNGEILLFQGVEQLEGSRPRREPSRPQFAQAVAVAEGRIVFVGSSYEGRSYVGPNTKVVDLGGRMVMPGIVDGHLHGTGATDCHLGYDGGTVPQILARLQACLDRADQVALHTINAAAQMHRESDFGSIEVGKLADLIVLSQNLFHVPTERISDTRVLLTMMGGRIVFDDGDLVRP